MITSLISAIPLVALTVADQLPACELGHSADVKTNIEREVSPVQTQSEITGDAARRYVEAHGLNKPVDKVIFYNMGEAAPGVNLEIVVAYKDDCFVASKVERMPK